MLDPVGKFFMSAAEFLFGLLILAHDKYKQWERQRRWAREAKQKKGGSDGE